MRKLGSAALAILGLGVAGCSGPTGGSPTVVRSVTVFGDSLNDVGSYHPATRDAANPGRFNVNPAPVWTQVVAGNYGVAVRPNRALTMDRTASSGATKAVGTARVVGGNGYAEGGARVSRLPSQSGVGNNALVAPVASQVDRYIEEHGTFPADSLVVIDGGTNDVYAQFSAICYGTDDNGLGSGNTTQAIADAEIARAASDLVGVVRRLKDSGAGAVLVAGAFDWSHAPFGLQYVTPERLAADCAGAVSPGQVTAWTAKFNDAVRAGVSDLPGVAWFDLDAAIGDVIANRRRFGFSNVTEAACNNTSPTSSAVFCTDATLVAPDAGDTHVWSDSFHPGPRMHRILGERALEELAGVARR